MTLQSKTIVEMFFEAACASPNQVAIELNDQTWTYGELLANVTRIIHHLEIKIDDIIYQYVDRSLEMICGLLGIMCAGGVYFPLNPNDSPTNIRSLIDKISGRCVLVHVKTSERFSNTISSNIPMINLEHILLSDITEEIPEQSIVF